MGEYYADIAVIMQEAAEDSSAQSNVSESTHWQADDGFKDEARSSRRRGQRRDKKAGHGPSTDDSSDAEPGSATSTRQGKEAYLPNGFSKFNGRPERRDRAAGDAKDAAGWENGGERQTRQRSHMRSSPHDFSRGAERTGSAKARAQPRVVPLPMPLPSDKGQGRADKQHPPERPASAAAGHGPSHRADDTRPASAHGGPSPSAAAAQAAAAAQDWPLSRAESASNAAQAAASQPAAQQEGRRRAMPQQPARPQPSKAAAEEQPAARQLATPVHPAPPVAVAVPVRPDTSPQAATPAAKSAPAAQAAAPSDSSSAAARAPAQAQAGAQAAPAQKPSAVVPHINAPMPTPVRIPQPTQAQPVVPVKALPLRPMPANAGAPSTVPKKIPAEQVHYVEYEFVKEPYNPAGPCEATFSCAALERTSMQTAFVLTSSCTYCRRALQGCLWSSLQAQHQHPPHTNLRSLQGPCLQGGLRCSPLQLWTSSSLQQGRKLLPAMTASPPRLPRLHSLKPSCPGQPGPAHQRPHSRWA